MSDPRRVIKKATSILAVRRESSGAEPRSAALVPGRASAVCRIEGAKAPRISAAPDGRWHGIIEGAARGWQLGEPASGDPERERAT